MEKAIADGVCPLCQMAFCLQINAEIERLRDGNTRLLFVGNQQEAEIERLRAALRKIAGHEPFVGGTFVGGDGWIMRNIARAALKGGKET